jgi:hypothetical protein
VDGALIPRGEGLLLVLTPFAVLAAVAVGLRVGASDSVAAAIVYSAPVSNAGIGLAWQLVAFEVTGRSRAPLAREPLEVTAQAGAQTAHWRGSTNEDGVAEIQLALVDADVVRLAIRAGPRVLADGDARVPPRLERSATSPVWMPFARRDGPIVLDVAVLGQRLAPGFSGAIWVRATDASTHARLAGLSLEPETEGSLTFAPPGGRTAVDGWGELTATPAGLAISLALNARTADGRKGRWQGGLFASPGAPKLETRRRWAPDQAPTIAITAPTARKVEYLEIDDAGGRVWGATVPLVVAGDGTASATVAAPMLPPGLYWAVAASEPGGATFLGPGVATLPFFVAATDASALAFGTDRSECREPSSARDTPPSLGPCLALAAALPVARWTALDGLAKQSEGARDRRARGIAVSCGSILVGMALETILVLRAAARGRKRREASAGDLAMSPPIRAALAVLVALLGFALIAAFVLRAA